MEIGPIGKENEKKRKLGIGDLGKEKRERGLVAQVQSRASESDIAEN